jgi:hypothetical protein
MWYLSTAMFSKKIDSTNIAINNGGLDNKPMCGYIGINLRRNQPPPHVKLSASAAEASSA